MDEKEILVARFRELSHRAYERGFSTHTEFLSLSEQNVFLDLLRKENIPLAKRSYNGAYFTFLGGHEESDRKILLFSPEEMTMEEEKEEEKKILSCLKVTPKSVKYSDFLTHRDYLGALMHLGYERNNFGDILTDNTIGYVFLLSRVAEDVRDYFLKVKHTPVDCEILPIGSCPFVFHFEDRTIHLAQNRLDAIVKEAFDLSRRDSQEKIGKEEVFVDGRAIKDNSYHVKAGERISVRGYGKFLYVGDEKTTRRNRIATTIRLFR